MIARFQQCTMLANVNVCTFHKARFYQASEVWTFLLSLQSCLRRSLVVYVLYAFLNTPSIFAQSPLREPTAWRVGVFGGYGINYHSAGFDALAGMIPDPLLDTLYSGSAGVGVSASVFFEKPLSHTWSLAARLSYGQIGTTFRNQFSIFQRPGGVDTEGFVENSLSVNLNTLTADPLLAWHPFFGASVYLGARLGASWGTRTLMRKIIDGTNTLTFYDDNRRERSEFTDVSLDSGIFFPQISATAGISYAFPLNPQETLFLAPEVWYTYGLTPLMSLWNDGSKGNFWNVQHLRGGLSIRYSPEAPRIFMPPALVRTAQTKQLAINITPIAVDSVGNESPLLRLTVEEVLSRRMHPILPYVFFSKNADTLPSRYNRLNQQQTSGFREEKLSRLGTLEIYYSLLNILGKRMKARPEATLRLIGTLSDDEQDAGVELGLRRAEAVMMYLRDVWRISPDRITIESRIKPTKQTIFTKQGAQLFADEEHRRVELYSDDWELLKPLLFADTLHETSPAAIKLALNADTRQPLKQWMLTIEQSKRLIQRYSGFGTAPSDITWNPAREHGSIPRTEQVVRCNFDFTEEGGEGATATISFPVEQITIAEKVRRGETVRRVDAYYILNADNTTSALPQDIDQILKLIADQRFFAQDRVTATGYNDCVLDTYTNAAQNLAISKARASAIGKALSNIISPGNHIPTAIPQGMGGKIGLFSELTPEGRMYSRMVEIRAESPKE